MQQSETPTWADLGGNTYCWKAGKFWFHLALLQPCDIANQTKMPEWWVASTCQELASTHGYLRRQNAKEDISFVQEQALAHVQRQLAIHYKEAQAALKQGIDIHHKRK